MSVAAVVLAAGGGRRFAASGGTTPKVLALVGGRSLVDRVVDTVLEAKLDDVIVVDGSVDLGDRFGPGVTVVHNRSWDDGLATSLAAAVAHADKAGHEAVVVALADQPGISADAWRDVAAAVHPEGVAVATYDGRRGHPVGIGRAVWPQLPLTGDEGARRLLRERPDIVVEVPCSGDPRDVDTLEDLDRWS